MSRPFAPGDRVLLIDAKKRRYLVTLAAGGEFHSHAGFVNHDDLLGAGEGVTVRSTMGSRYIAIRPTLADFVFKMPRGAQVISPKALGPILLLADIFPGARVLESGVGSGALSMTMLRAPAALMTDPVLRQRPQDGGRPSYQIASLIDDVEHRITFIVRGADLLPSTACQLYLADRLGLQAFKEVLFIHHPLITDAQGRKLSKSEGAEALKSMRERGSSPVSLLRQAEEMLAAIVSG